jgi:hypothetical protein
VVARDETFDLLNISGLGLVATASVNLMLKNISFMNKTSGGIAFSAVGAQGSMEGIQFFDVGAAFQVVTNSLGYTTPTGFGVAGMFVQCVSSDAYTELGTAGAKYTTLGWVYDGAAWRARRAPSGN